MASQAQPEAPIAPEAPYGPPVGPYGRGPYGPPVGPYGHGRGDIPDYPYGYDERPDGTQEFMPRDILDHLDELDTLIDATRSKLAALEANRDEILADLQSRSRCTTQNSNDPDIFGPEV